MQPFEDTGSLNLWANEGHSGDSSGVPSWERDSRVLELSLHDHLEGAATQLLGSRVGLVLAALARKKKGSRQPQAAGKGAGTAQYPGELARANDTLHAAADHWKGWVRRLPVEFADAFVERPASELVGEFLELGYRDVIFGERWTGWKPGADWDFSRVAPLNPRELRERCRAAPAAMQASFASICDRGGVGAPA